jgi:serine-threonine kinase receptor-associated protein
MYRKVWDTHSGECLHTLQHSHIVRAVTFSPGRSPTLVATGGFEKKLRIFDISQIVRSNEASPQDSDYVPPNAVTAPSWELGEGVHQGTIKSVVWGPDQNTLITAADDKVVRWWDIRQKGVIASYTLDGPLGSCELNKSSTGLASNSVLSVGAGKTAYFFSGTTPGQLITSFRIEPEIASVAVDLNEEKFVVGSSSDTWVHVYSFKDGQEINYQKGHHGPIWSVSFSPDAKLYATGSEDGTIKLWKHCSESYGLWR